MSLDCLDHAYFQQEITKLLRICYEIEMNRFKQRNAKGTPEEWRALKNIKERLEILKSNNENFVRFEPNELLNEMYELSSDLDMIKIGQLPHHYYQDETPYYDEGSDDEYYD